MFVFNLDLLYEVVILDPGQMPVLDLCDLKFPVIPAEAAALDVHSQNDEKQLGVKRGTMATPVSAHLGLSLSSVGLGLFVCVAGWILLPGMAE